MRTTDTPLKVRRQSLGITLKDLAHFSGVAPSTLSRLERGRIDSDPVTKAKVARALRTPVSELWPSESVRSES